MEENLWPSFGEIPDIKTPKSVLTAQAMYFEKASYNLLKAEVSTISPQSPDPEKKILSHRFKIIAPLLGDYSFILFRVQHDVIFMYPATIVFSLISKTMKIENEEELTTALKEIFSSPPTINVIQKLLAQSKAAQKESSAY